MTAVAIESTVEVATTTIVVESMAVATAELAALAVVVTTRRNCQQRRELGTSCLD